MYPPLETPAVVTCFISTLTPGSCITYSRQACASRYRFKGLEQYCRLTRTLKDFLLTENSINMFLALIFASHLFIFKNQRGGIPPFYPYLPPPPSILPPGAAGIPTPFNCHPRSRMAAPTVFSFSVRFSCAAFDFFALCKPG